MAGVAEVFPQAEHRECMFHLVSNFKKHYSGKVFDDHLWAAAYSWNPYLFEKHWVAMEKAKPAATNYLRGHTKLWNRSQFSTICKLDYVTNNLAECLNNWIKHHKSMNLDDLLDMIRQLLMVKWNQRRKVGRKLDSLILPYIIQKLNEKSRDLSLEVMECSEEEAEVTALGGSGFRFVVKLQERTCSCRQWQVSGIPCKHALAFITSLSNAPIENYVDLYYSVDKFRAAYGQLIPAMPDKSEWPKATHGFFMHPSLLRATAGRPKTQRYKGCVDKHKKKRQHKCPICLDCGHHWHNCKKGNPDDIKAMMDVRGPPKKRAKTAKSAQSSIVPLDEEAPANSMTFPPSQTIDPTPMTKGKSVASTSIASKCQSLETTCCNTKGQNTNSKTKVSKRCKSRSGSNQPDLGSNDGTVSRERKTTRPKPMGKRKRKELENKTAVVPFDSPAMATRSKRVEPASPAMNTRSKRRLSL